MSLFLKNLDRSRPKEKTQEIAWEALQDTGLPSRKDELFRLFKWSKFYKTPFEVQPLQRISTSLPKEAEVLPFQEAKPRFGTFMANRFRQLIERERDPFVLANLACHSEGTFVYIPSGVEIKSTLKLTDLLAGCAGGHLFSRIQLFVGKGSSVTIDHTLDVDSPDRYLYNSLIDLHLEEGADVCVIQDFSSHTPVSWAFHALRAYLKSDANLSTLQYGRGSEGLRADYLVQLAGERASCSLHGLALVDGEKEAHTHVQIDHLAPHCTSSQLFKNVLFDRAKASFIGKIFVDQVAQKTDAFQLSASLMMSEHARALSQPNLEICADDVKASHGATVGQLSQEEMFYLQSRGFSKKEASRLLLAGFVQEVLHAVDASSIQSAVGSYLSEGR